MKEVNSLQDVIDLMFGRASVDDCSQKIMDPNEFSEKMWRIKIRQGSAPDDKHIDADELMCELLESLGYREGVRYFKEMEKWYS